MCYCPTPKVKLNNNIAHKIRHEIPNSSRLNSVDVPDELIYSENSVIKSNEMLKNGGISRL